MTYAPDSIKAAQRYWREQTGLPWVSLGIIGSRSHKRAGTSYHLGEDDLKLWKSPYSVDESPRDRRGLTDAAAALDIGDFGDLVEFNLWLVAECERGAADTLDIREVIYYDGHRVRRWDREGVRDSGDDSHKTHTHIAWYRDSEHRDKTAVFRRYFEGGHASAPSSVPTGVYREGDSGWGVERLQAALNEAIDAGLDVDGRFGPATAAAVRELQRRADITIDGVYGNDSETALRHLLEDDMALNDELHVTSYTEDRWGVESLDVETALSHTYTYSRNASDYASTARLEQAAQTALLQQIAAGQSGLTEEAIAAAVADGVRSVIDPAALASAIAEGLDAELDVETATRAVEAALRSVLGGVDEAAQ